MEAALFGFLGTLAGGAISILVALVNNRKDVELKDRELLAKREELLSAERAKERERRLDKYAAFLGAYRQAQGAVVDIIVLIRNRPKGWSTTINEIVDSKEYIAAIERLNDGSAWIALLCRQPRAEALATQLSAEYDALIGELRRAKTASAQGDPVDTDAIDARRRAADSTFDSLLQLLRTEMSAG